MSGSGQSSASPAAAPPAGSGQSASSPAASRRIASIASSSSSSGASASRLPRPSCAHASSSSGRGAEPIISRARETSAAVSRSAYAAPLPPPPPPVSAALEPSRTLRSLRSCSSLSWWIWMRRAGAADPTSLSWLSPRARVTSSISGSGASERTRPAIAMSSGFSTMVGLSSASPPRALTSTRSCFTDRSPSESCFGGWGGGESDLGANPAASAEMLLSTSASVGC